MKTLPNLDTLAKRLKYMRKLRQMTQEKLAEAAQVDRNIIARIEAQKRPIKFPRSINALAEALDCPVTWLLFGMEEIEAEDVEVIQALRALSTDQKSAIRQTILSLAASQKRE